MINASIVIHLSSSPSTPFVCFTNIFTSKILCGRDGGSSNFLGKRISQLTPALISIGGRNIYPHMGIDIVHDDTVSEVIHNADFELGFGMPLFSSKRTTSLLFYSPVGCRLRCYTSCPLVLCHGNFRINIKYGKGRLVNFK